MAPTDDENEAERDPRWPSGEELVVAINLEIRKAIRRHKLMGIPLLLQTLTVQYAGFPPRRSRWISKSSQTICFFLDTLLKIGVQ